VASVIFIDDATTSSALERRDAASAAAAAAAAVPGLPSTLPVSHPHPPPEYYEYSDWREYLRILKLPTNIIFCHFKHLKKR